MSVREMVDRKRFQTELTQLRIENRKLQERLDVTQRCLQNCAKELRLVNPQAGAMYAAVIGDK